MKSFSMLLAAVALASNMAFAQTSRFRVLHLQSDKLKADSVRIECTVEIPKDIGLPTDNPFSLNYIRIYKDGTNSYRRWTGAAARKAGCSKKEMRRFSYTVYHEALKFIERNESSHDYSFHVTFYIHKVAKRKVAGDEGLIYDDLDISRRVPRAENADSYLSCDGQFLLKLHPDGEFEYTRAVLGQTYGGHWSFHGDTLTLSSPYFENNPRDLASENHIYIYKYTDESYDDRFILKDGLLYPIMRDRYRKAPFMPYSTTADRRRYRRDSLKYVQ